MHNLAYGHWLSEVLEEQVEMSRAAGRIHGAKSLECNYTNLVQHPLPLQGQHRL